MLPGLTLIQSRQWIQAPSNPVCHTSFAISGKGLAPFLDISSNGFESLHHG